MRTNVRTHTGVNSDAVGRRLNRFFISERLLRDYKAAQAASIPDVSIASSSANGFLGQPPRRPRGPKVPLTCRRRPWHPPPASIGSPASASASEG
jgi:hypothetical protein